VTTAVGGWRFSRVETQKWDYEIRAAGFFNATAATLYGFIFVRQPGRFDAYVSRVYLPPLIPPNPQHTQARARARQNKGASDRYYYGARTS